MSLYELQHTLKYITSHMEVHFCQKEIEIHEMLEITNVSQVYEKINHIYGIYKDRNM